MVDIEEQSIEVFENEIEYLIHEYTTEIHPEIDINKSQSQWNATLKYIYRKLFKPDRKLLNNQTSILNYNDAITVFELLNYYIELCNIYNREVSNMGFHNMTGISIQTMYNWSNDRTDKKLSGTWFDILKRIETHREESLRNKAFDNGNVTGTLALLNHDFAYNMPGVRSHEKQETVRLERADVVQIAQNEPVIALPGESVKGE